jgi:hypothetical protein
MVDFITYILPQFLKGKAELKGKEKRVANVSWKWFLWMGLY